MNTNFKLSNSQQGRMILGVIGVFLVFVCMIVCCVIVLTGYYFYTFQTLALPEETFVDQNGVTMRLIPAGEFTMGSNKGYDDAKPAHQIYLDSFYIDQFEVTNALYTMCVDSEVCLLPRYSSSSNNSIYYGDASFDNYPVVYVDWFDAKTFCEWRGMRLPTEAEWEKAARGNDGRTYPWGEDSMCGLYSNCDLGDTIFVGAYESGKSVYGVYDMGGNVSEWVSSLYKPYPYLLTDGREDLTSDEYRIIKGGSWNNMSYGTDLRSFLRSKQSPSYNSNRIGFRCARDIVSNPNTPSDHSSILYRLLIHIHLWVDQNSRRFS